MIQHRQEDGLYVRRGTGPSTRGTLLWIHGLGESGLGFEQVLVDPRLAAWSMAAPDLAGYGKSPWSEAPLGMQEHAEALADWLRPRFGDPFVVLGHSMGGVIGTKLCEILGDQVRGFINVEGNISIEDCSYSQRVATWELDSFLRRGFDEILDSVLAASRDDPSLGTYYPSLRLCDPTAFHLNASELVELSRAERLAERMAALPLPSCYLYGAPGGTGAHSRGLLQAAGIEPIAIDGAGHWPFLDQRDAFSTRVAHFLMHEI